MAVVADWIICLACAQSTLEQNNGKVASPTDMRLASALRTPVRLLCGIR